MVYTPTYNAPAMMMQMITGFWTSCCIHVAAKLDIADILADGTMSIDELAERTRCDSRSLYRVLRALSRVGVFRETETGAFGNTGLSDTLRSGVPGSLKALAITQLGDHLPAWGNLMYSVKTGRTAFDRIEGMTAVDFYETHPDEGSTFTQAMEGLNGLIAGPLSNMVDLSGFSSVVEIGAGRSHLLTTLLTQGDCAQGIVFDNLDRLEHTEREIHRKALTDRCSIHPGNIFEQVPPTADAYLMNMILHDHADDRAGRILEQCANGMAAHSRLLAVESVIPEGNKSHPGKFMDINMMAMTGGQERTEKEFKSLAEQAGLDIARISPLPYRLLSLIEFKKKTKRPE
jgi:hypothetical protein